MNSNKNYDFYKSTLYYLIANAVLLLIGILIVSIFGFNAGQGVSGGKLVFMGSLSVIFSLALVLVYVGLRHGFSRAFSIVLICTHNILLSTIIIGLIRIPVSEALIMGYLLMIGLTTVLTLVFTENIKNIDLKKVNYSDVIKAEYARNAKKFAIICAVFVVVLFLSLIVATPYIFSLARILFVMAIVLMYSAFTITLPVWMFFSAKIRKVKKVHIDENVENQKVVKAVEVEGGDNSSTAETENI